MKCIAAIASFCLALPCAAAPGTAEKTSNYSRAVPYYAEGLGVPLLLLRGGFQLLQACEVRFREQCSETQRDAAASGIWTLRLLDALTLFPERFEKDPSKSPANFEEFGKLLRETSEGIVATTLVYDMNLFARFGAVLRTCPPPEEAEHREYLANMKNLDLRIFGKLTAEQYANSLAAIEKEEAALADKLKQWPAADCTAAGELGHRLLLEMYSKLEPWMNETTKPGQDFARAATADFLFKSAAELERRVNPAMKPQWRAINEEREKSGAPR